MGAKEGFVHLMWVLLEPGDAALVPSPSYPIHIHGPLLAGAGVFHVPMAPDGDLVASLTTLASWRNRGRASIVLSFPHNPTTATVDLDVMEQSSSSRGSATWSSCTTSPTRTSRSTATAPLDPPGPRRDDVAVELYTLSEVVLDGGVARRVPRRQPTPRRRSDPPQVVAGLRHVPAHPDRGDRRADGCPDTPDAVAEVYR